MGFCGFCLVECGRDAHGHVGRCELNPAKGSYFADKAVIAAAQGTTKRRRVVEYLRGVTNPEDLTTILKELAKDLGDLKIQPIDPSEIRPL